MPKHSIYIFSFIFALIWQSVYCVSATGQTNELRIFRPEHRGGIERSFSDMGSANPLRLANSTTARQSLRNNPHRNNSENLIPEVKSETALQAPRNIRLANYQESSDMENRSRLDPLETEFPEEPNSSKLPSLSNVRQPIGLNPFSEIRQHDSHGLLNARDNNAVINETATYADLTGKEHRHLLAGYKAHQFHHNPLYFEEPNLERYGNELEFQRLVSGAKFFANAALLPCKLSNYPACSRVSTLGHKRPGEFVPYREYGLSSRAPKPLHYPRPQNTIYSNRNLARSR